jgi:hypothetical protein
MLFDIEGMTVLVALPPTMLHSTPNNKKREERLETITSQSQVEEELNRSL